VLSLFFVHALHFGLAEPSERAIAADRVPKELRGTAFGAMRGLIALVALPANLGFGAVFDRFGASAAFSSSADAAIVTAGLFVRRVSKKRPPSVADPPKQERSEK